MSLKAVLLASEIEQSDDFHCARLLVLLLRAGGRFGTKPVDGITKFVKMDFFVRYPIGMVKMLSAKGISGASVKGEVHEYNNIESRMIRFRYGPWDGRYRRWLAVLVAKRLVVTSVHGKTIRIALTPDGVVVAKQVAASSAYEIINARAGLVAKAVGGMSGNNLKNLVYQLFPEILTMGWGKEIEL